MQFDLGLQGIAILVLCSLVFGAAAHLVLRPANAWLWLVAAAGWFVGGLLLSEVLFATMTEGDIQPIVDGLAFDESLLGGALVGVPTALVARWLGGGRPTQRPMAS